jgi:betaine reductase
VSVGRPVAVLGASLTLQHVPDLVRYGSKPLRESARWLEIAARLRPFEDAVAYPPNQAFIGNLEPDALWAMSKPWWSAPTRDAGPTGSFGEIVDQPTFYAMLGEADRFQLVRMKEEPRPGELALYQGGEIVGAFRRDHDEDEALTANVLLENLACKAGAVHALRDLLARTGADPLGIGFVLSSGEEAIGDRYQRGGGNLAKAVAEDCGLQNASGSDVKAFCAGPILALIQGGALVASGVHERVAVVAGGSLPKLGMKFRGALERDTPILEDVLAAMAVLLGPAEDAPARSPVMRLDAVGRHRIGSGSSQQALLEDIVGAPLAAMGRRFTDIDRFATELHNPEVTEPAGGGDVPERNYRMLAGLAVLRGELGRDDIATWARAHGLPGYSPTQGHIASAIPWLPHALAGFRAGTLRTTMLFAKGSLFLGRMTRLWDGASFTLEA